MTDPENVAGPSASTYKSLKELNRWQLGIIIASNSLIFYGLVHVDNIKMDGLSGFLTHAGNLLPVGTAVLIATVLNGLLSPENKARLVFLRWRNALPGHRAFSQYAESDPRIDLAILRQLEPSAFLADPIDQNRAWYRMFKRVEKESSVRQLHRDYLLLRDYTGFGTIFLFSFGIVGFYAISSMKVAALYFFFLAIQCLIVRHAALNYGIRFVTTVLAQSALNSEAPTCKGKDFEKTGPKNAASKRVTPTVAKSSKAACEKTARKARSLESST